MLSLVGASVLTLSSLLTVGQCAVRADRIFYLPGWEGPLPSKQFSGYLSIPNSVPKRMYHYWLVESENNPLKDPIVFWWNGGPGASSMLGYFNEQGPFNLNDNSEILNTTAVPKLFYNNYTWAKVANLVFIESPAGVGFSKCNGKEGPMESCPDWTDTSQALDNHHIIQEFFKYYPEYITNDMYLSGESYAGVYVPTIVMQIERDPSGMPPLVGFAVGNGCMGENGRGGCNDDTVANFFQFMWGHSQMSNAAYFNILNECGSCIYSGNCSSIPACHEAIDRGNHSLGGYNLYNIYDECYALNDELESEVRRKPHVFRDPKTKSIRFHLRDAFNGAQKQHEHLWSDPNFLAEHREAIELNKRRTQRADRPPLKDGISPYACGGGRVLDDYMNMKVVKDAIHVEDIPWWWCDGAWNKYTSDQQSLMPYYTQWAKKYKILIFYGDVDVGVPYNGGEYWTMNLGYDVDEEWRPWTMDGGSLVAGYVQTFKTRKPFTYVTVRGAGHEVPTYKPKQALAMFTMWLRNEHFPYYNKGQSATHVHES